MTKPAGNARTFLGIQALRGVAACLVVVFHATQLWWLDFGAKGGSLWVNGWANGASGVDIFFVISGFVMTVSSTGERVPTATKFLERRLLRIAPLYWIFTLLLWLKLELVKLHPAMGSEVVHVQASAGYVIASLLFIPWRNSAGDIAPLLEVGWTLQFEMLFYLLFACALALRVRPVRFLTPAITLLVAIGIFRRESWPSVTTLTAPILLEFLAGVLLGYAVMGGLRLRAWLAGGLGAMGLAGLLWLKPGSIPGMRVLEWGVSAMLLVGAAAVLEGRIGGRIPQWMLNIGDASYSLYLLHGLVLLAIARVILRVGKTPNQIAMAALCLAVVVPISLVLHRFLERPMTFALGRWSSTKPSVSVIGVDAIG